MKEVRAVVLGLVIVVLVAMVWAFWARAPREYRNVRGFVVDIRKQEGASRKHVSFKIPMSVLARIASFTPLRDVSGNWDNDWGRGEISGKDILDAAAQSSPGNPGIIERNGKKIEVTADGAALEVTIKDEWDKKVTVRLPKAIVESLSDRKDISIQEILKRLDELGPGDLVRVQDGENEVTITAQAR
jgi:hypothetical protein